MKYLAILSITACVLSAQDAGLKARELFYTAPADAVPAQKKSIAARTPANRETTAKQTTVKQTTATQTTATQTTVPAINAANVPLGLRYSVLRREGAGKFVEVDADSTFRSGDRIRLHVDANTSGYLYVVMQGSSGNWRLLFPSSSVDGGNNRIEKGASQQIPAGDTGQFLFDQQSGTEKIFLVLSRKPEMDLDKLIYSITGAKSSDRMLMAQAAVGDDVVNRLRDEVKSRDLVFEKVDEMKQQPDGEVTSEKATYVVNPKTTDDARLVVDVALKHGK